MTDLHTQRLQRWWCDEPPLRTIEEAQEFVDDVGFAVLFGGAKAAYPCLREVSRDDSAPMLKAGWGEDLEMMWTWKDELPVLGRAWLGRYLGGKQTLLAPALLADLYEFDGEPDDFDAANDLSPTARMVAELLLAEGPTPTGAGRAMLGMAAKTFDRGVAELGRRLLVTHYGVHDTGSGWPSCVLELTARVFDVPAPGGRATRDAAAAARYVDTMVQATPRDLKRAFGWPIDRAAAALQSVTPV